MSYRLRIRDGNCNNCELFSYLLSLWLFLHKSWNFFSEVRTELSSEPLLFSQNLYLKKNQDFKIKENLKACFPIKNRLHFSPFNLC